MRNKKIIIILAILIVLIGGIFLVNNIYQNKAEVSNTKRKKQNNLAIIINSNGVETSSNEIPKGNYILNEEKTICENGGKVKSYDSSTGQIGFSFLGSDRCTLYFDEIENEKLTFKQILVANNIDIFDENPEESINNLNTYGIRYEGPNPNNYICLDKKNNGLCDAKALFRIIGLFDEECQDRVDNVSMLKIMQNEQSLITWGSSDAYNIWNYSHIRYYLNNGEYIGNLLSDEGIDEIYNAYILYAKWHFGSINSNSYNSVTTNDILNIERSYSSQTVLDYPTFEGYDYIQFGLMYISDYAYATRSNDDVTAMCRNQPLAVYSDELYYECSPHNWIYNSSNFQNGSEWFIASSPSDYSNVFSLNVEGYVDAVEWTSELRIRPVFYLDESTIYVISGNGSISSPYRISIK